MISQQRGFIDDESEFHLLPLHPFNDLFADEAGDYGLGSGALGNAQFCADLPIKLQDGSRRGDDVKGLILGRMQLTRGLAKCCGFAASDLTGHKADAAQAKGIVKTFLHSCELRGLKDFLQSQITCKGFSGRAKKSPIVFIHRMASR
jgi:hypothetical protein